MDYIAKGQGLIALADTLRESGLMHPEAATALGKMGFRIMSGNMADCEAAVRSIEAALRASVLGEHVFIEEDFRPLGEWEDRKLYCSGSCYANNGNDGCRFAWAEEGCPGHNCPVHKRSCKVQVRTLERF